MSVVKYLGQSETLLRIAHNRVSYQQESLVTHKTQDREGKSC